MAVPSPSAALPNQAMLSLDGFFARLQGAGFLLRPDDYAEILQVIATFSPQTPNELVELIAPLLVTSEEEQHRFYALFAEHQRVGVPVAVKPLTFGQRLRRLGWYWLIPVLLLFGDHTPNQPIQQLVSSDTTQIAKPVTTAVVATKHYLSILSSEGPVKQVSKLNLYQIGVPSLVALLFLGGSLYLLLRPQRPTRQSREQLPSLADRFASQRPPYTLPLPNRESELIVPNRAFTDFVTTLRHRSEDEVSTLNVAQTLSATVRSGGLPELIFKHRLREEEFLFLIDHSRIRSQQLSLFEFLYHALSRESVCIERFFYQVPFGQFRNERFPNGISLSELANRYQSANLIILGDGYPLLFDDYDVINPTFLNELRRWEHRAILTPVPFPDWNYRERALQMDFLVLPADVAGQLRLMQAIHDNQLDQTAYLKARTDLYSIADVDFKDSVELRGYLGDELFQWLCATAVYGKVRWEVLIEMGHDLLAEPHDLSITNLLKLARISWLREGNFPDAIRLELLKALRPDNELKARQTLLKLLYYADVKYPDGYFFDEERHLLRTTNQFVLFFHQPEQYPDYATAVAEYKQLWQDKQLPDGTMQLYLENPTKTWDNLLGTGTSRTRLMDRFTADTPATARSMQRWIYWVAATSAALLIYIGYLLWQKPAFALTDEPVTYTFIFRPSSCLTLSDLKTSQFTVKSLGISQTLTFRNTVATVSLPAKDSRMSEASLQLTTPLYKDSIRFPLSEQRHTFDVRGENCRNTKKTRIEIFYSESHLKTTKYLADKVKEALEKESDFEVIQSPLSDRVAAKYDVAQNEIRYDSGNKQEYDIAVDLQKIIGAMSSGTDRLNFILVQVVKQKTPGYISIFVVQNNLHTTTDAAVQAKAMQPKQSITGNDKGAVAQNADENSPPNKFVFNTGKAIQPLNSPSAKNSLSDGIVVPGAPWVLVDILQFDRGEEGSYELVAATAPYAYPSSQYIAYLLPVGAVNQQELVLNPDGKYTALGTFLRNRLSISNLKVNQIQTVAQLPAYQDPMSIKSLLRDNPVQRSTKASMRVIVLASINYNN